MILNPARLRSKLLLLLILSVAVATVGWDADVSAQTGGTSIAGEKAKIVGTVNFRTAPSTSSSRYGVLTPGTTVQIVEEVNAHWLKVKAKGKVGYISAYPQYVQYSGNQQSYQSKSKGSKSTVHSSALADRILKTGEQYYGTPYRFGANYGSGYFDCSSFVQHVYKKNGIDLPRTSRQQSTKGTYVKKENLKKGDLLFFWTQATGKGKVGHVAIYAGNGKILHTYGSPGVTYSNFSGYWEKTYMGAKRVIR